MSSTASATEPVPPRRVSTSSETVSSPRRSARASADRSSWSNSSSAPGLVAPAACSGGTSGSPAAVAGSATSAVPKATTAAVDNRTVTRRARSTVPPKTGGQGPGGAAPVRRRAGRSLAGGQVPRPVIRTNRSAAADHPALVPDGPVGLVRPVPRGRRRIGRSYGQTSDHVSQRARCPRTRPVRLPAPLPTARRGCLSARRAVAAWRRTAPAEGSAGGPADRRTATRSSARPHARARNGRVPAPPVRGSRPARWALPAMQDLRSVRPASSGWTWVCTNHPGRTRAPSRARPECRTGATGRSPTGGARCRDRCPRRRAAAGSVTCRSRWSPGPRRARRTRPRGRTAA